MATRKGLQNLQSPRYQGRPEMELEKDPKKGNILKGTKEILKIKRGRREKGWGKPEISLEEGRLWLLFSISYYSVILFFSEKFYSQFKFLEGLQFSVIALSQPIGNHTGLVHHLLGYINSSSGQCFFTQWLMSLPSHCFLCLLLPIIIS